MRIVHINRSHISALLKYRHFSPSSSSSSSIRSISRNSRLVSNLVHISMAAEEAPILPVDEDSATYGFQRPEMYSASLAGTAGAYGRHVFLCYKSPVDWPSRVESSDADPLPKLFASALKSRKNDFAVKTMLTICEGREGTEFSDGDVLLFPDMIKYRGLKESDVDKFVEDVVLNGKPWDSGVQEALTSSFVFVCSHGSRDRRCGVCGPVLIEKINEEIGSRGINGEVIVSACSHVGGHKYAGNLIIFSPGQEGNIEGHWYGYVTPDDVPELLDQHIGQGEVIERLWRGQMGMTEEDEKAKEQKLPNGEQKADKKKKESVVQENKESSGGCCQGANGGRFTCCRDGSVEESGKTEGENPKEQCNKEGSNCKIMSWVGSFEQKEVLTVTAVLGAVAAVAVAYSYYKKSR